eukprot:6781165-Pyramimonas_sp.AAC.1
MGQEGCFHTEPMVGGLFGDPFIVGASVGVFVEPAVTWSVAVDSIPGTSLLQGCFRDGDVDLSRC